MADWGSGLSGAGTGALTGFTYGGPVGAAVGGGIGLLTGLFGGGKKNAIEEQQILNAREAGNRSRARFQQSETALAPVMDFNTRLLSGDPGTAISAIGPEVNTILGQYDTARQAVAQNGPRGGGATRTMANLPFEAAGKITNILNTSRRGAAQDLSQLFAQLSGSSTAEGSRAVSATGSAGELALTREQQQYKQSQDLGKAFGSIFSQVLFGKKDNDTSGGSPLSTPPFIPEGSYGLPPGYA